MFRGRETEELKQEIQRGKHTVAERGIPAGDPVLVQPENPQQRNIRRIGEDARRRNLLHHAVFKLSLGKFGKRLRGKIVSAEQGIKRHGINVGLRKRLAAAPAWIVDDVLACALVNGGYRSVPDRVELPVGTDEIRIRGGIRGIRDETQDRLDRFRGSAHTQHDVLHAARFEAHPRIGTGGEADCVRLASQWSD